MWTRRRTWIGGQPCDDDWIVYHDRRPVGRVYLQQRTNPTRHAWTWFKQVGHGRDGDAETLEAALEALRAAVLADQSESSITIGQ